MRVCGDDDETHEEVGHRHLVEDCMTQLPMFPKGKRSLATGCVCFLHPRGASTYEMLMVNIPPTSSAPSDGEKRSAFSTRASSNVDCRRCVHVEMSFALVERPTGDLHEQDAQEFSEKRHDQSYLEVHLKTFFQHRDDAYRDLHFLFWGHPSLTHGLDIASPWVFTRLLWHIMPYPSEA